MCVIALISSEPGLEKKNSRSERRNEWERPDNNNRPDNLFITACFELYKRREIF